MSLVIALVLAAASQTTANSALSDWMPGLATNYGGPSEGMNPNNPSYGLKDVSPSPTDASPCSLTQLLFTLSAQQLAHACPQLEYVGRACYPLLHGHRRVCLVLLCILHMHPTSMF